MTPTGTETLTNKTLTAPVIATIVNTGVLTLPTSTDTLVGRATTDTLTNKTLTAPVISSISNTGVLTLPTSTDTLVGRATTDTLTNKTISGANNTLTNIPLSTGVTGTLPIANGGTNSTATATAGGAGYGTGTAHAYTAAGTSGQLLQSNGASAPTWVTASASGLTLVQTVNASGSTAVINGFSASYDNYILIISDVYPAADGRNFEFKFYIASTLITGNYQYAYSNVNSSSASSDIGATGQDEIRLANSMDQSTVWNRSNHYVIYFFAVNGSSTYKSVIYDGTYHFSNVTYSIRGAGTQTATAGALTGAQFAFPGSSFGGGKFQLYGYAPT